MKKIYKRGFTLLELLVVIAIIGILVAIGTASYTTAQKKSRDARRQSDLRAIQDALEQIYADNNGDYTAGGTAYPTVITNAYMPNGVPTDPRNSSVTYDADTFSTTAYQICADLENNGTWDGTENDFCVYNLQ